ncbi:hypothetical protein [Desmospora activa]|uniref:Uncharacterized protein n=1 Tax=Desmospora activa DSM 45169 TaxID=1121389 RepID=A0A2T4Z6P9_9BACL|nr:hypothetical protein [Desmospora activa]PTM57557.1 hypothetical protein C8J48_0106 [Desmospora activa DSM 45169]
MLMTGDYAAFTSLLSIQAVRGFIQGIGKSKESLPYANEQAAEK